MPGNWSPSLLYSDGPVYVRERPGPDGVEIQHRAVCDCAHERDWLIVIGGGSIELVCRCGRAQHLGRVGADRVAALTEAIPPRAGWTSLQDAICDLGFAPHPGTVQASHHPAWYWRLLPGKRSA